MRPFLVALTAAFMPVAASSAELVEYMGGGYRPSIHILDERTKVCGTSFSAVIGTRRKVLSITGTVFSTWNEGNPPGLAIHVRASEVVNRKLDMGRRRVRPAVFRVDGTDTRSLSAAPRNGGLLLETDAGRSDLVFTFPRSFRKGAWAAVQKQHALGPGYRSIRIPLPLILARARLGLQRAELPSAPAS
jgi:hypothetical protein